MKTPMTCTLKSTLPQGQIRQRFQTIHQDYVNTLNKNTRSLIRAFKYMDSYLRFSLSQQPGSLIYISQ